MTLKLPAREHDSDEGRARRRRGAQEPKADRADLEDVARIDRQQRGGAAQEHREEIERDGAEDDRPPPDVGDAFGDSHERGAAGALPLAGANPEIPHHDDRKNVEAQAEQVVHLRTELVEEPADRRPGDGGGPVRSRVPGDRLGQAIERTQGTEETTGRRAGTCPARCPGT